MAELEEGGHSCPPERVGAEGAMEGWSTEGMEITELRGTNSCYVGYGFTRERTLRFRSIIDYHPSILSAFLSVLSVYSVD